VNVLLYPTFQSMPGFLSFLDNLPPALKTLIGDVRSMGMLEGFLKVKIFDPLPLLLALFVVPQGARLIAGETEDKSIDLLMAQPVRRRRVVLEKYLALASAAVILCGGLAAGLMIGCQLIGSEASPVYLVEATGNALPLTWLFAGLALVGSCLMAHARRAALLGGFIVVASYIFESLRLLSPPLSGWRFASLFAYYKDGYSLTEGFSAAPILVLLALTAALVAAAVLAWERRDLAS
jgi:ABC-2 type transport system permease protein